MIPFVRDITFEYGACDQVSPLIRRVVANNPGPFTFLGTGTYIIGKGRVAVIDPGPDLDDHLEAILAATAGETITDILITHHHADHSPLAGPLKARTGARIQGCPPSRIGAADGVVVEADEDESFRPEIVIRGGEIIRGPGWTLEAVATPGHTLNHICFALHEENALFSGDHIMGWSTTVVSPPGGDMTAYMESLQKVADRKFDTLWPTHGPPITEVAPFIAAYAAHRRAREAQFLACVDKGVGRIADMVPELYAAVDKRLHPAAANSLLGHAIDLVRRGVLACDGEPGPGSTYRRP
ncbi:MBL fold metallo-hydrolase [Phenylobacterium sp.]|uniref:MBL fold metallo-hydrolase n=1 Tax=Phenylobacterium sp. TaxID=1871053 RepID=UPI0025ED5889|nr:MBL fold metallo-hydrolase [Phenylobacterium sp.]MCA6249401.1 MBL fold metallo-hydrolase [Phenylobacterium sp.]MCA6280178.1 MBL fold metallo-hydrolase [Phenylobacterium sp.]MCA6314610.1 MBL fold metallo-hydrolase [Phenylobacterium sp.]